MKKKVKSPDALEALESVIRNCQVRGSIIKGELSFERLPENEDPLHTCVAIKLKRGEAFGRLVLCRKDVLFARDVDDFVEAVCVEISHRLLVSVGEQKRDAKLGRVFS